MISAPTKSGNLVWGAVHIRPTKSGYPVWGTVHIHLHEKRKPDTVGGTYPPGARCSASPVGAGPRPARQTRHPLSFSPTGPGFPSLRPRRGGPRGRPPGSVYLSLRPALAATRPHSLRSLGTYPGPRPQRFRVGGIANSREAAGAHCAPLRKDGYPMRGTVQARRTKNRYPVRRADDIRPYDKTGAQHSGRIISAPTTKRVPGAAGG